MSFLELVAVEKSFGSLKVLKQVRLSVEQGECVAIVGFSGSGKTTLISLMAGLLKPDSGKVLFQGLESEGPGPDRGIVFQNYSLLPWLSVFENIHLAVTQRFQDWTEERRRKHTQHYIDLVKLGHAVDRRPGALSGGMRQRVSLARAMALDPEILLLDEPLSALDALTRADLQDEFSRISAETGKTIVLITNDPDEALLLADRVIPLSAGPEATLGPSFAVEIPRPRDRDTLHQDPEFKRLRLQILDWLLGPGAKKKIEVTKSLVLPDIEPEDLSLRLARPVKLLRLHLLLEKIYLM